MNEFEPSGLFEKQNGPAATITGRTNGTEHFNFTHAECGEGLELLLKFLDLEKSWYYRSGEQVPFWVGRFETTCPQCKQTFTIKLSFSDHF